MTDVIQYNIQEIVRCFERYQQKPQRSATTAASGSKRRVLVLGFGLFDQAEFNISGTVVSALTKDMMGGKLVAADHGGRVNYLEATINGDDCELCSLIVDVRWDLSAAILLTEMQRFQPQLVLLTGRGGETAVIESGALDRSDERCGYDCDGKILEHNRRTSTQAEDKPRPMTWQAPKLLAAIQTKVKTMGHDVIAADSARPSNIYICNHISYAALKAAAGETVTLAGGRLNLELQLETPPVIGFFHFPRAARNETREVEGWVEVLREMIHVSTRP